MKKVLLTLALASLAALPVQAVVIPFIGTATTTATGGGRLQGSYNDSDTDSIAGDFTQTAHGKLETKEPRMLLESTASQTLTVTDSGFSIDAKSYASAFTIYTSPGSAQAATKLDATFTLDAATRFTFAFDILASMQSLGVDFPLSRNFDFVLEAVGGGLSIDVTDFHFLQWPTGGMPNNDSGQLTGTYTTTLGPGTYHLVHGVSANGLDFSGGTVNSKFTARMTAVPDAGSLVPALAAALGVVGVVAHRMRR